MMPALDDRCPEIRRELALAEAVTPGLGLPAGDFAGYCGG